MIDLNKPDSLAETVGKLSIDVHTMKGNQKAGNELMQMFGKQLDDMRTSQEDMRASQSEMKESQAEMKESQDAGRADTTELLDIFRTTKAGVKFIVWFGSAIKWGAGLTAAVVGAWYAFRNGSGQ